MMREDRWKSHVSLLTDPLVRSTVPVGLKTAPPATKVKRVSKSRRLRRPGLRGACAGTSA